MNFKEIKKHKIKQIDGFELRFKSKMSFSMALISNWKSVILFLPEPIPTDEQTATKRDLVRTEGYLFRLLPGKKGIKTCSSGISKL